MTNWKKIGIFTGMGFPIVAFLLGGFLTYKSINSTQKSEELKEEERQELAQEYFGSDLKKVISEQENILGIKHFGEPKLSLGFSLTADASYYPQTDLIKINNSVLLKRFIAHELGHFYADKVSEGLGRGDWPIFKGKIVDGEYGKDDMGLKLIAEGIATYFESRTEGDGLTGDLEHKNFSNYNSIGIGKYYNVGNNLVKPILDKDVRKGVELLVANPPTSADLEDLVGYKKRMLERMEELK